MTYLTDIPVGYRFDGWDIEKDHQGKRRVRMALFRLLIDHDVTYRVSERGMSNDLVYYLDMLNKRGPS